MLSNLFQKLKNYWAKLEELSKKSLVEIWNDTKFFIIPVFILIVVVKFRDILINILINSAKQIFQGAEKKDQKLDAKEIKDSDQADKLVQQAQQLSQQQPNVDVDWYKNEKK